MNSMTRIVHDDLTVADVDLTTIMKREGIRRVEQRRCGVFTVELFDDRIGSGYTVALALEKAHKPGAYKVTQA